MKVKELILELSLLDPELDVMLQKDPEGNGYAILEGAEKAVWDADADYTGSMYNLSSTAEDNEIDKSDWENLKKNNLVVVLWPGY